MENFKTKELDSRRGNGLIITLWWVENTMQTFVTVVDTNEHPPVEHHIDVPEGVEPQHVFQHPMTYLLEAS